MSNGRAGRWTLTDPQLDQADTEGTTRQRNADARGGRHRNNRANNHARDLETNKESAGAEFALALFLGGEWTGTEYEVKHTARENGRLIVQLDEQRPDRTFVLVTGKRGKFTIRGYISGHDAMQERFKWGATGRPAYFVPQTELHRFGQQRSLF